MPKDIWRLAVTRRTLPPLDYGPLILQALQTWPEGGASPVMIEAHVVRDGGALEAAVLRAAKSHDCAAIFELNFSDDRAKLRLSEQACAREVHTPRRRSRQLATLRLWEPVRVVLNGKADWPSGRLYYLLDYHVVLCSRGPCALLPARTYDLQADLV